MEIGQSESFGCELAWVSCSEEIEMRSSDILLGSAGWGGFSFLGDITTFF